MVACKCKFNFIKTINVFSKVSTLYIPTINVMRVPAALYPQQVWILSDLFSILATEMYFLV